MINITHDIVAKLWNLCNVLKDDGVTYHQYVTELTYLLFLKMAKETGAEQQIPAGYRWGDLEARSALDRFEHYKFTLIHLGSQGSMLVQEIFANASSFIKKPATLSTLVVEIDKLDWYSARQEGLGDLYEGLLEKNANEKKSGAGQYFTPRPLIDCMVAVMKPKLEDVIQDPAAGTGGFLIAANRYLREHAQPDRWTEAQQRKYRRNTFYGMEHVQDAHRLALMNLMLHGLDSAPNGAGIRYGDTLGQEGEALCRQGATLILTNPPFGAKKGGGLPTRTDFTFPTSNKQFCFLQHIYRGLKPGGRGAVVMPDNVLFEGNTGRQIRVDLMDKCNLHTILRLPTGIFYAQGVKTNVLFFTRGATDKKNTREVWVYDLRANMPQFGKRTVLTREHFAGFEDFYGPDSTGAGLAARHSRAGGNPETSRFRRFSREEIAARGDSLDISWLKDESDAGGELPEPAALAREAMDELEGAMAELRGILGELGEEVGEVSGLPQTWVDCRLGDLVHYGATQKVEPSDIPENAWVLELEDIEKDTSKILQRFTFAERQSKSSKNRFFVGDVLYGKLRPYLNKVVRADQDGYCTTEIVPLPETQWLDNKYLFYWLKHPAFLDHVISVSHGLNMPRLGTEAGRDAPFVLAPVNEQKRVADKLDAVLARVDACRERLDHVPAILKGITPALLAKAFRGELAPQDPGDEPASALLERIRAIRTTARSQRATSRKQPKEPAG